MKNVFGFGFGFGRGFAAPSAPSSNWILATGRWNDAGVWDDSAKWID